MIYNTTNSVFVLNSETSAQEVAGCGQEVVSSMLKAYPLIKKRVSNIDLVGASNIVVLKGWTINGQFVQFNPQDYAKRPVFNRGISKAVNCFDLSLANDCEKLAPSTA